VNFVTDPQGEIDRGVMSLDEAEATFTRKPQALEPALLARLAGTYKTPDGFPLQVVLREDGGLYLVVGAMPERKLVPYRGLAFRTKEYSDVVFEFVLEKGQVTALRQTMPSGEYVLPRATSP
jgi:hypothetical protein